jgi:hypothetical protein
MAALVRLYFFGVRPTTHSLASISIYIYIYILIYRYINTDILIQIYIYIYIEREREREREVTYLEEEVCFINRWAHLKKQLRSRSP